MISVLGIASSNLLQQTRDTSSCFPFSPFVVDLSASDDIIQIYDISRGKKAIMLRVSESKTFYKKFLILAAPIAVQNLLKALMYFIDNIMIGALGETAIVGVGNANQIAFFIFVMMFGICSAAWIFAARHNGEGDCAGIKRTLGFCLAGTLFVGLVFFLLSVTVPHGLIGIFNQSESVMQTGGEYISIVGISYIFTAVAQSYASVLRGCQNTRLPMFTAFVSLCINAGLNYVLIFGKFGFPAMGVAGAAIGTVVGSAIDAFLLILISYIKRNEAHASLRDLFPPLRELRPYLKQFVRVGLPVILNESLWALFAMVMVVLYNQMGLEVAAAMAVFSAIERMAFVVYAGIGNTAGVMLGNLLGEGSIEKAHTYARRFLWMSALSSLFVGLIIVTGLDPFLSLYDISGQTLVIVRQVIIAWLCVAWLFSLNYTNICGVLRSGGDTRFSLYIDLFASWLITAPLAWFLGLSLSLPVYFVYMAAFLAGDAVKALLGLRRFYKRKWIIDITAQTRLCTESITIQ